MEADVSAETKPAAEAIQDVEMADGDALREKRSLEEQMAAADAGPYGAMAVSSVATAKIAQIVDDYARLASVSAAEISRKRQAVRAKCQERLWMAAAWRDYQLEQAQKAFEADLKALEKEHQVEFASLKEALLQELQEERKRLQQAETSASLTIDRSGNLVPGSISGIGTDTNADASENGNGDYEPAAPTTEAAEEANGATGRRLRRREERSTAGLLEGGSGLLTSGLSQGTGASGSVASGASGPGAAQSSAAGGAAPAASGRRRPANSNINIYTYNTLLGDQEILDDLGRIAKEAGSVVPTRRAAKTATSAVLDASKGANGAGTSYSVSVDRGVLNYQWDRVSVGDRLRVRIDGVVAFGKVTLITDNELSLRMAQGASTAKTIPLADLRSGRVVLLLEDHGTRDDL